MNYKIPLSSLSSIISYLKNNLVGCVLYSLRKIIPSLPTPRARKLRFWGIVTLTSLLLIVITQLNMAPVRSQLIDLPESLPKRPPTHIIHAGNLDTAAIKLDGKLLFRVAAPTPDDSGSSTSISPIERRVKQIQFNLSNIVKRGFDPDTLKITPSILNNQTVLIAYNQDWEPQQLLTVTAWDVEVNSPRTIDELAQKWSKSIQQALLQAWLQRQPKYQRQQIPVVLVILAVMVTGSFGIRMLQKFRGDRLRILQQQQQELEATKSNPSAAVSSPTVADETSLQPPQEQGMFVQSYDFFQFTLIKRIGINLILRQVLFAMQAIIWFGGMAAICQRFPRTRAFGSWLLRVPLAYIAIFLGMGLLKLVFDTLLWSYLKSRVERLREHGSDDVRLHSRAGSIFSVLNELNRYLAVLIDFLLFCYLINAIYVALAAIALVAFLAQNMLKDFATTYFILVEDQYALGDWIQIGDIDGQVEKISLRNTQIREACGDLHTIAHGTFTQLTNFTHRHSGINLWIDVAYSTDLDQAMAVIEQVAKEMQKDSVWGQYILTAEMKGVETFGDNSITIRLILMTDIGEQWRVGREYRRRLKPAFDQAGISIPFPQRSIWFENALASTTKSDAPVA